MSNNDPIEIDTQELADGSLTVSPLMYAAILGFILVLAVLSK
jgi:hypothetical protein